MKQALMAALAAAAASMLVTGCGTTTSDTAQGPRMEEERIYATGSRLPVRKLGEPQKAPVKEAPPAGS